jgi:Transposase domain (DUF772)
VCVCTPTRRQLCALRARSWGAVPDVRERDALGVSPIVRRGGRPVCRGCRDDFGVQGRPDEQRELLDAESIAGHLLKAGSVFAFMAGHRQELVPDEMFADLFPSGRGRPSVPADVMAAVIALQALHGLSDAETVDAVTFDLRWKAACELPRGDRARHRDHYRLRAAPSQ